MIQLTSFADAPVWKYSHKFAYAMLQLSMAFPDREQLSMTQELRNAAFMIPNLVANQYDLSKNLRFNHQEKSLLDNLGKCKELVLEAVHKKYLSEDQYKEAEIQIAELNELIHQI